MEDIEIGHEDPTTPDVRALIDRHLTFARDVTPPEDVHALGIGGLTVPGVTMYGLRERGRLLAMGALKELDPTHGELKSMHTAIEARGRGFGRLMVDHLVSQARARGYGRVSLETGRMPEFTPAIALYASAGFVECPPFADYWESPNSVCMTMELG